LSSARPVGARFRGEAARPHGRARPEGGAGGPRRARTGGARPCQSRMKAGAATPAPRPTKRRLLRSLAERRSLVLLLLPVLADREVGLDLGREVLLGAGKLPGGREARLHPEAGAADCARARLPAEEMAADTVGEVDEIVPADL